MPRQAKRLDPVENVLRDFVTRKRGVDAKFSKKGAHYGAMGCGSNRSSFPREPNTGRGLYGFHRKRQGERGFPYQFVEKKKEKGGLVTIGRDLVPGGNRNLLTSPTLGQIRFRQKMTIQKSLGGAPEK